MPIKLVILEDEREILNSLNALLAGFSSVDVVRTFTCGRDAVTEIPRINPDVALVDLKLKERDMSGIDVIREVRRSAPSVDLLVFTKFDDDRHLFSAIREGAVGYLLKDSSPFEIIKAVEEVYKGGAPMSRRIARRIMQEFHSEKICSLKKESVVTIREKELLEGMASGLSRAEMGTKFRIADGTVQTHLKNIYKKLHAHSRAEAVMKAREKGVI